MKKDEKEKQRPQEAARPDGWRESFATANLPEETIEKIAATRMNPRHDHLNRLLDEPQEQ